MLCITTALHAEAAPLIRHYNLKKVLSCTHLELFCAEEVQLAVSGIGKTSAVVAVTLLMTRLPALEGILLVNLGIAGARSTLPVGTMCVPNKVRDAASNRTFFPDMLLRHSFCECALVTADFPVKEESFLREDESLVDMEASAFMEAGLKFLPPSNISVLKIVSDHLSCENLNKEIIQDLVEKRVPEIAQYLNAQLDLCAPQRAEILSEVDLNLIESVSSGLKLTTMQRRLLRQWCVAYRLRGHLSLEILGQFSAIGIASVRERRTHFQNIKSALSAE